MEIGAFEGTALTVTDALATLFADSPIRITSVARLTNGHIMLQAVGLAGVTHTVQASPDLSPNSFQTLPNSPTADGTGALHYDDSTAAGSTKQFYRIRFP